MPRSSEDQRDEKFAELKAFDESMAGVKGLVDAGIMNVPAIFHISGAEMDAKKDLHDAVASQPRLEIPVIDISALDVVERIRQAAETWGFFQILGHGVPIEVIDEMIAGIRRFNEQDSILKAAYYSRDRFKSVSFTSSFDLYQNRRANWKDTLICAIAPVPHSPEELPATCREIIGEYSAHVSKLGETLLELLSEGLGLRRSYLNELECDVGQLLACHYSPPCPQPELTIGTSAHSDAGFITVLLQDDVGGLQVRYQGRWVDVPPLPGALVVNIGDLLQIISNDRFPSMEHRVLASERGPRVSAATFFTTYHVRDSDKIYGPVEDLLSEDNPPRYGKIRATEFYDFFYSKGLSGKEVLNHYRL